MTTTTAATAATVVGIDLGTLTTKITLSSTHDFEIVRNAHGGHTTPTAVTFAGPTRPRLLGEDAADISRGDENTVWMMDRLLTGSNNCCDTTDDNDDQKTTMMMMQDFCRFQFDNHTNSVYIPNMDTTYDTTALLAMLLGRVKRNVLATIQRRTGKNNDNEELEFVFAVPSNYPQVTRQAVMDAAYAVKVNKSRVVDGARCLAAVYQRKFDDGQDDVESNSNRNDGDEQNNKKKKTVLVVEMGHSRSCVSILQCVGGGEESSSNKEEEEASQNQNDIPSSNNNVQVLSTVSSATLGAAMIDIALFHHVQSNHPSLSHNTTLTPKSRPAQRLMEGCRKLKHILSMLPEGNVTVETIGKNDTDVSLTGNRELLKSKYEGQRIIDVGENTT